MKVELIDYTGAGQDPWYAARLLIYTKNTRLEQGEKSRAKVQAMTVEEMEHELKYIAGTLRSSWEFIDYSFEIRDVTRAFTHQFVRTRTGTYAQQTQRSVNMNGFTVERPITIKDGTAAAIAWNRAIQATKESYHDLFAMGIPAQDARGLLPTNIHTNIIAKFNLRTLADLVGKRINPRAQGEYTEVVERMVECVKYVHPWILPFLFPARTYTPHLDKLLKEAVGDKGPLANPEVAAALKEVDMLKGTWG